MNKKVSSQSNRLTTIKVPSHSVNRNENSIAFRRTEQPVMIKSINPITYKDIEKAPRRELRKSTLVSNQVFLKSALQDISVKEPVRLQIGIRSNTHIDSKIDSKSFSKLPTIIKSQAYYYVTTRNQVRYRTREQSPTYYQSVL